MARFLSCGLLLRPLGNVLYFMPPYVIRDEEAHWALDQIEDVLRDWQWETNTSTQRMAQSASSSLNFRCSAALLPTMS
jgi:hypothetical protein